MRHTLKLWNWCMISGLEIMKNAKFLECKKTLQYTLTLALCPNTVCANMRKERLLSIYVVVASFHINKSAWFIVWNESKKIWSKIETMDSLFSIISNSVRLNFPMQMNVANDSITGQLQKEHGKTLFIYFFFSLNLLVL